MNAPRISLWRVVFYAVIAAGLWASVLRTVRGLGASTALTDEFPWGLWIGFDVLCGVGLAAGGFTITAAVYLLNLERFKPIVRPTILTAFLGYLLVIVALMYDLGRPLVIWHAIYMWNPNSVMFEVAWCVMLYTTVLAFEFSPILFEGLGWKRAAHIVHKGVIPLVVLGVILSTLHQSSLGSLFLIVPSKLHPLWYTPLLPAFFILSAIGVGLAMVIFESFLSYRAFRKQIEPDLLRDIARVLVVVLAVYTVLRFEDLSVRGALGHLWMRQTETYYFWMEIAVGAIIPALLLAIPRVRYSGTGLFGSAALVVLGFLTNRLNVSITGMQSASGVVYVPKWTELAVTLFLVALGFALFTQAVKYLPIYPSAARHPEPRAKMRSIAA